MEAEQGERIIPASRRPDGTMRKEIRIRAGYVPQEEVAIYQSKGALLKKSQPLVPPGYDPETDVSKPKTKAAKKNEKRKEKRIQARAAEASAPVEALTERVDALEVSETKPEEVVDPSLQSNGETGGKTTVEKKIRALKKKIRLAQESSSSQQQAKVQGWQEELEQLELRSS